MKETNITDIFDKNQKEKGIKKERTSKKVSKKITATRREFPLALVKDPRLALASPPGFGTGGSAQDGSVGAARLAASRHLCTSHLRVGSGSADRIGEPERNRKRDATHAQELLFSPFMV